MIATLRNKELLARVSRLPLAKPQILERSGNGEVRKNPKISFVMTHVSVCGGVKIILEHANRLNKQGWDVCIISHFPKPDWYPITADYKQVPFGIDLAQGIPMCDVIIATYWDHIQACIETGIAPVVYFEQGDEHLFHPERLSDELRTFVETQMKLPKFIMTVSNQASSLIKQNFGRESVVIPNAINHSIFKPREDMEGVASKEKYILMMGNEDLSFKGIHNIVKAFEKVKAVYPDLKLFWINPKMPSLEWGNLADEVFVNPSQEVIAALFRDALVYVSASEYESFSLPVLEAMATGCPVISTRNSGVLEYGEHEKNLILTQIGDLEELITKIILVIESPSLRRRLSFNGMKTAKKYNWDKVTLDLMNYLQLVSTYNVRKSCTTDWEIMIDEQRFFTDEDLQKFRSALNIVSDDTIYVPVIYNWLEGHPIARWEVAARRVARNNDSFIKVYSLLSNDKVSLDSIYLGEGIGLVTEQEYEKALQYFVKTYPDVEESWKLICTKWIVLCLIELERDKEASQILVDSHKLYPYAVDLHYLNLQINLLNGNENVSNLKKLIRFIGEGLDQHEWFFDLYKKVENY
ncbi:MULTISPECIES: glycosyltransferase family 4 protein [Paenibacillus]|uniref:Glycosyl transferase group 1 n=2 Tax=Paenibacillus lactis TaxID=228574 RepID=G4HMC3_9BACL|nr:glycosyltransferase family 4 protein [Paenibacillus lactis]EHB54675.1 glycosyl transferase group 1 [Paenibacillus lactis 154]MBP1891011.1 glycosyltransferase involved in cell wall biosynthesis [Paenibacillus lactis]HAF99082.1 glycosyl transferase family 1 [Paenibacillus lactis]